MKRLILAILFAWKLFFPCILKAASTPAVGIASIYAKSFSGRRTASGKRFDPKQLTAAHRSLPFGSKVRIFNLTNMKFVDVEITDRGPWKKGRILDLSYSAAQSLGMIRQGVARVIYTPLPYIQLPEAITMSLD